MTAEPAGETERAGLAAAGRSWNTDGMSNVSPTSNHAQATQGRVSVVDDRDGGAAG